MKHSPELPIRSELLYPASFPNDEFAVMVSVFRMSHRESELPRHSAVDRFFPTSATDIYESEIKTAN